MNFHLEFEFESNRRKLILWCLLYVWYVCCLLRCCDDGGCLTQTSKFLSKRSTACSTFASNAKTKRSRRFLQCSREKRCTATRRCQQQSSHACDKKVVVIISGTPRARRAQYMPHVEHDGEQSEKYKAERCN